MSDNTCQDDQAEPNFTCPSSLENSSGVEACEKMKRISEEMQREIELAKTEAEMAENITETGTGAISPFAVVNNALDNLLSNDDEAESDQTVLNDIKATLTSLQQNEQFTKCENDAYIEQNNSITVSEGCASMFLSRGLPAPNVSGNIQTSNNAFTQKCQINAISDALTSAAPSIENEALQNAINNTSGGDTSSESLACTTIDTSTNACSFLRQRTCCKNQARALQSNLLDVCAQTVTYNEQSNINAGLQNCLIGAGATQTVENDTSVDSTTTQKSENTTGNTNIWLFIVLGIVILGIGAFAYSKKNNKSNS